MKRIWTIIGVRDVRASFKWYQSLFGMAATDPGHDNYDLCLQQAHRLVDRLAEDQHVNPNTRTREFSLRDPDGYFVTISEC